MRITINAIELWTDILDCITTGEIRKAALEGEQFSVLAEPILHGWPSTKTEVQKELQPYWSFSNEIAILSGTAVKGGIFITASLQDKVIT